MRLAILRTGGANMISSSDSREPTKPEQMMTKRTLFRSHSSPEEQLFVTSFTTVLCLIGFAPLWSSRWLHGDCGRVLAKTLSLRWRSQQIGELLFTAILV